MYKSGGGQLLTNRRAFTLIELLAVIVILAIIALIAVPIILNIIEDAREESNERSVELYASAVKNGIAKHQLNGSEVPAGTYKMSDGGKTLKLESDLTKTFKVDYEGNVECTTVEIKENGKVILSKCTVNGGTKTYDYGTQQVTQKYIVYSVGDEVTIGTEKFYVIEDSDVTQEKVTLLAKDCINTTNLVQSTSTTSTTFSATGYWFSDATEYPYNITEEGEPDDSHYAAKAAYNYGVEKFEVTTGRLMTYDEAIALESVNSDILYGRNGKSSSEYLNYWIGTAINSMHVYIVRGTGTHSSYDKDTNPGYIWAPVATESAAGESYPVRPVIEVLKSKLN